MYRDNSWTTAHQYNDWLWTGWQRFNSQGLEFLSSSPHLHQLWDPSNLQPNRSWNFFPWDKVIVITENNLQPRLSSAELYHHFLIQLHNVSFMHTGNFFQRNFRKQNKLGILSLLIMQYALQWSLYNQMRCKDYTVYFLHIFLKLLCFPLQMSGHFVQMNVGCDNHAISLAAKNDIRLPKARECFRGNFHHHNPQNSFCGFRII